MTKHDDRRREEALKVLADAIVKEAKRRTRMNDAQSFADVESFRDAKSFTDAVEETVEDLMRDIRAEEPGSDCVGDVGW